MKFIITLTIATVIGSFFVNKNVIISTTPSDTSGVNYEAEGLTSHTNVFDTSGEGVFVHNAKPACDSVNGELGKPISLEKILITKNANTDDNIDKVEVPIGYTRDAVVPCTHKKEKEYIVTNTDGVIGTDRNITTCETVEKAKYCLTNRDETVIKIGDISNGYQWESTQRDSRDKYSYMDNEIMSSIQE